MAQLVEDCSQKHFVQLTLVDSFVNVVGLGACQNHKDELSSKLTDISCSHIVRNLIISPNADGNPALTAQASAPSSHGLAFKAMQARHTRKHVEAGIATDAMEVCGECVDYLLMSL